MKLITCQAGFEPLLARELESAGSSMIGTGPGWAGAEDFDEASVPGGMAFPHAFLQSPVTFAGQSVNVLAQGLVDSFCSGLKGERIESAWPCVFAGSSEPVGLGRRISSVEDAFHTLLKKKLSRVARLATAGWPRTPGPAKGLFVWFTDFGTLWATREADLNGQRRMADDELAPSRSYLKVEEAYLVMGREPQAGETVCDLGAAPGGWSYSAAKRGALVTAIDNGPLKGGAAGNSSITHLTDDAFRFEPREGGFDWLFCDLLEEPHHVVRSLIGTWLANRWCRRFVVNLKFGRVDPIGLLAELRDPSSLFMTHASHLKIRHLYHDREEFTVTGELRP